MEYIEIKKTEGGVWDLTVSSDGMEGLQALLIDSYYITLGYDGPKFIKEYEDDTLKFNTDSFYLKSVEKNLVEVCAFDYTNNEDEKYVITLPKDALWEFIPIYQAAEKDKNWTTLKVGFDGKQFKLWLDGEEYDPDQNKLEKNK